VKELLESKIGWAITVLGVSGYTDQKKSSDVYTGNLQKVHEQNGQLFIEVHSYNAIGIFPVACIGISFG